MIPQIPELLWHRAWLLGTAHNHEWAIALACITGGTTPAPMTEHMLSVIVNQHREEHCFPGVGSPFIPYMSEGAWRYHATHTTGTRRCQWSIDHTGAVSILISRPHPNCAAHRERGQHGCELSCSNPIIVLTVTVDVAGAVEWTAHADCGVPYGMCHVEAATSELRALGVDASVPLRIAECAAFADGAAVDLAADLAAIDHWEDRAAACHSPNERVEMTLDGSHFNPEAR